MKKFVLNPFFVFIFFTSLSTTAQVGIGTTTPEGALDLNPAVTNNFGFIPPRIALTGSNVQGPLVNPQGGVPALGTIVYNTAIAGVAPNNLGPGLYIWTDVDGPGAKPARWIAFAGSPGGLDWSLLGNASTNIATDFLGTPDAVDLAFRTNNLERMRVISDGKVVINATAVTQPDNQFEVVSTTAGDDAITGSAVGTLGRGVQGNSTLDGQGVAGFNNGIGNGVIGVNSNPASQSGAAVTGLLLSTSTTKTPMLTFSGVSGQSTSEVGNGVSGANFGNGIGVYAQTNGGTLATTASVGAVYASLTQTAAGNQDVAGVIGTMSNIPQGPGGYSGPTAAIVPSALAGVSGSLASRVNGTTNDSYFFGVVGQLLVDTTVGGAGIPRRSGGVLGENSGTWASLAYKSNGGASALYGLYASTATNGNGIGKTSSPVANNSIGMGINGGFMGGYIQGSQYGLISKGQDFGMYVDGNTITNKPYIQLIEGNNNRVATYASTSTSVDVTTRGKGKLTNGEAFISFNEAFKNAVSSSELLKSADSEDSINITVTPVGESNGIYIKKITEAGFYIKENNKGKSNVTFNWTAVGTQKGFEKGIKVSDVVLAQNFDTNIKGVMTPDTEDQKTNAIPIYFDGNKVRFEEAPDGLNKPKLATTAPRVNATIIKEENPKDDLEKK